MKRRFSSLILAAALLCSCSVAAAEIDTSTGLSTDDPPPEQLVFAQGDPDPFAD